MCHLCGGKKNKKQRVGLSVGILAVPLQYILYVFGHLSKWFVLVLMFKFWSICRLVNGRPNIGYNGSQLQEVGGCQHEYSCGEQNFH
jgi:hypothetical protein